MISTKPSDDILEFLAFLQQTVGAEAARDRLGASPSEIELFREFANLPLPTLYLGYLREFGQRDGILKMADDADSRVTKLNEFYREQKEKTDSEIPANGIVIGAYGLSGERTLLYPNAALSNLGKESPGEFEPTVIVSWWGDLSHTYAQTFRNHLYRQAFTRGRFNNGALFSLRRNDEELLRIARGVASNRGFQAYWFSDDFQVCLERDDDSRLYIVRVPSRTTLYGCFANQKARDELKRSLIDELGLQDSTPG